MVYLLTQETTEIWHLALVGAGAGCAVGGTRWGMRGVGIGVVIGAMLGTMAPFLYLPFWLYFTLPPHPKIDL